MVSAESEIYARRRCVRSAVSISCACFMYSHGNLERRNRKINNADHMLFVHVDVTGIALMCLDGREYARKSTDGMLC